MTTWQISVLQPTLVARSDVGEHDELRNDERRAHTIWLDSIYCPSTAQEKRVATARSSSKTRVTSSTRSVLLVLICLRFVSYKKN